MTPILGIMASQISGHLFTPTGSMFHISTTTLSTATATVTFSSIPADYTHLQIRMMSRCNAAGDSDNVYAQFNSDTASNYSWHYLNGDALNAGANGGASSTTMRFGRHPSANPTTGIFGGTVCDILDYTNTNKYKTTRSLSGYDSNGTGGQQVYFLSSNWRNTAAVTSISLTSAGGSFITYSSFSLYGVK